jgi:hypothetical protein
MRPLLLSVLVAFCLPSNAQLLERHHPNTVRVKGDTLYVRYSNLEEISKAPLTRAFTTARRYNVEPQMNYNSGIGKAAGYAVINYGGDSIKIDWKNPPYRQYYYINFESDSGAFRFRLGFEPANVMFSDEYKSRHKGTIQFDIPEVYELANIIWNLSPSGQRDTLLVKNTDYYRRVFAHFKPYLDHPVFKSLDFPDSTYYMNYYGFRENSFCFAFEGDKIVGNGTYNYVFGADWDNFGSLFKTLLPQVEDFAKKSGFRKFYSQNQAYYRSLLARQQKMMPVKAMWTWLEKEFPDDKYDSYRIVFSPLITGSHSTQKFFAYDFGWFSENIMFVCGPERYDSRPNWTEAEKSGELSGVVFTEIDHNYVNPVSARYGKKFDTIFSPAKNWVAPGQSANWYSSPQAVFNEYMTHAVFCLWVKEYFDGPMAKKIIENREALMVDRRLFYRFREFNKALMEIKNANPGKSIPDLYPQVLEWCEKNNR